MCSGFTLQAPNLVDCARPAQLGDRGGEPTDRTLERVQPRGIGGVTVSGGAQEDGAGVHDLREDNPARDVQHRLGLIREPILLPPQQYIPGGKATHGGEEPAVLRQQRHGHASISASTQERGGTSHPAEADNTLKVVERQLGQHFAGSPDLDRFALLPEVGALGRHIQSVEMHLHGAKTSRRPVVIEAGVKRPVEVA
jgi:hypothetical protein